ncbi:hypothetical protein NYO98_18010 [Nocardioides sp. STR2]|uniref:Uncharacterized protein n=1 Tax=Nocardioides pini TaxID=2975053 RepID=A0ABT4CGU9_9ACTN|nr:hypothetical protein [Nocardioides pini]MCY4728179.1 hypothetical protein [Nocardioides pini]
MTHGPTPATPAEPAGRRRPPWLRPVVVVVIVLVCGWLASTFLGAIDWSSVAEALGRLTAWEVLALVAVLLVRQTLNALPLALFIDGLGAARALLSDLVASVTAVVAPPPGDMVVRVAMFRGWGIEASRGLARGHDEHGRLLREQVRRSSHRPCGPDGPGQWHVAGGRRPGERGDRGRARRARLARRAS